MPDKSKSARKAALSNIRKTAMWDNIESPEERKARRQQAAFEADRARMGMLVPTEEDRAAEARDTFIHRGQRIPKLHMDVSDPAELAQRKRDLMGKLLQAESEAENAMMISGQPNPEDPRRQDAAFARQYADVQPGDVEAAFDPAEPPKIEPHPAYL